MQQRIALDWLVVAALTWPHLLYAAVWFHPSKWRRLFPKQPVVAFARAAAVGKCCQFSAVLAWFVARHPDFRLQSVSLVEWALALTLIVVGQVLNVSIYRAIGQDGVYYGIRLGKQVPWCDSFPFSVVSHPQYVGSIMSIWGAFCLTLEQQNQSGSFRLAWFWSMLYITSLVTEESS